MQRLGVAPLLLLGCMSLMSREYGPAVGTKLPGFELQDQDGKSRTLQSLLGPKGAMIVFYRSVDW